ncbi:MAG: phosphate starvation-inducible protein PsiF [Rhizobiales bacterium]|nr:phosphate starvation-inducible protein PsiF [Hyphomicrobiales bacterium]
MTLMSRTLVAACASLLLAGSAFAQTPAPATGTAPAAKSAPAKSAPAASTKPAAAKPARSAVSLDCSKQADAKGLHGKERKKFRSDCKRDAAKKN